jgi:hypothetical protein
MALAETSKAIGAVSLLLKSRIDAISTISTSIGRPSDTASTNPHLNLFLYEISFDPHLKNTPLNEGEKPPLWVVLKYLLTAFESATDSDSEKAHEHLGAALRAIYTDDLLKLEPPLSGYIHDALSPNPSPLHVTFDDAPSDLVAKLMQGPDEKVRLSASFQVRPVMIASDAPGNFSLLVGVDPAKPPVSAALVEPFVGLNIIPSMGARIEELKPTGFEVGEEVAIHGADLHLTNLSVTLGAVELPVTFQRPDELRFRIDPLIAAGAISAGSHPVTVVQTLDGTGRKRKSNAFIGNLVPSLKTAKATKVVEAEPLKNQYEIDLTGVLLGDDDDDTILAFYKDGRVVKMFDVFELNPASPVPGQTERKLIFQPADLIGPGEYNLILIVNGQQAPRSPKVTLN